MLNEFRAAPLWQRVFLVVGFTAGLGVAAVRWAGQPTTHAADPVAAQTFGAQMDAAMRGDHQAQRNIAYGFAAAPYPGQEKNRVLGCAWYLVVINSGHPKADVTDDNNVQVCCGSLEPDLLNTARDRAGDLLRQIRK